MNTQHARTSIATGTCLTLGLAVAVACGAVPQVNGPQPVARVVSAAAAQPAVAHVTPRHPSHHSAARHAAARLQHVARGSHATRAASAGSPAAAPATPGDLISSVTVRPAAATVGSQAAANIRHATHHKKRHHHHHKKTHHKPKPKPTLAPRTTPSSSALSSAIAGLRNVVHTPFTPTSAQVAQFGDEVCSAFDQNESFAHVKSVILQKVKQLPFTTVTAGAADYVVKTAVALYCPGYTSRVS